MRRYKECNACKNWRDVCIMFLREISQNKTDVNIAFSVLFLFLKKVPGKGVSDYCVSGIYI